VTSPCDSDLAEPADQAPTAAAEVALRARLGALTPGWAGAPIARSWACLRTFAADGLMRLARDPDRPWLVWAAGLGGHGATASPAVGEAVAAAVVAALG
jgi:glycine/D-amino acid oxidase-like deaminating enzyme